ncbi:aldehyde dehydrogenase family protein [Priestia flexa]|uniref:aldehyde dehydrogenase family protein n=1 Tax=Priestia flexa TaxID=86664 RepID=UPI001CD5EF26|nr:aldehyde dehydrogenase family protein [Priestia flexa]MCA1203341.1 aldehyde dehydrogenase family protein [Priestia flexa]WHX77791.1 aldehyde dehydrogenase family protein [Priestia flexa]
MVNTASVKQYGLYVDGEWSETKKEMNVLDKYTQETAAKVSVVEKHHVDQAVQGAKQALKTSFSPYTRYEVLMKVVEL